jgi:hypothetical protein
MSVRLENRRMKRKCKGCRVDPELRCSSLIRCDIVRHLYVRIMSSER